LRLLTGWTSKMLQILNDQFQLQKYLS